MDPMLNDKWLALMSKLGIDPTTGADTTVAKPAAVAVEVTKTEPTPTNSYSKFDADILQYSRKQAKDLNPAKSKDNNGFSDDFKKLAADAMGIDVGGMDSAINGSSMPSTNPMPVAPLMPASSQPITGYTSMPMDQSQQGPAPMFRVTGNMTHQFAPGELEQHGDPNDPATMQKWQAAQIAKANYGTNPIVAPGAATNRLAPLNMYGGLSSPSSLEMMLGRPNLARPQGYNKSISLF